jgi:hypothetical protein
MKQKIEAKRKTTEELTEDFFDIFPMYCIQHCYICRPSYSTVSEDAGIELLPWQSEALTTRLDLLHRTEEILSKRMMIEGVLACLCMYVLATNPTLSEECKNKMHLESEICVSMYDCISL